MAIPQENFISLANSGWDFSKFGTPVKTTEVLNNGNYSTLGGGVGTYTPSGYFSNITALHSQANKNPSSLSKWMGKDGYLSTGANVLGALGSLANAYTGLKGLQLAKDQFAFEKGLAQANLANQADLINEQRLNSTNVGLALAGNTMTNAQKEAVRNKTLAGNVKGTI